MTSSFNPDQSAIVRGLRTLDFRRIADRGFGDPHNAYPHSMAWFNEHLYVGTTRACLAHRGRRRNEVDPSLLGAVWPVRIPEGLFDIDLSAEIWRYDPRTGIWKHVYTSPMVMGTHGEETPLCICFRAMEVFQGKNDPAPALYLPTMGSRYVPESVMLRCSDGENFEIVSEPGMGFPNPYRPRGVRATVGYKSRMFTSPAVGQLVGESNVAGFMVIGVTDDPAGGEWQLACEPHFGDRNNLAVGQIAEFNGYLYAGTLNVNEGFQVWKTDASGDPPYTWTRALSHGAWRGQLNQVVASMCEFQGSLYLGTAIQEGGYDSGNNIGPASTEVLRIHSDDSWDLLVGEPRLTPDGLKVPLSGLGPGFGKPFAGYLWAMCEHEGWLYAGTLDWFVHVQFSDVSRWSKDMRASAPREKLEHFMQQYAGFDLWRTRDGSNWIPVTHNGFNNPYNYGIRTMVSSPYGLFVGATNPYGPEVAVERVSGWQYEQNPRGGLEIWFGCRNHSPDSLDGRSCDMSLVAQDAVFMRPQLEGGAGAEAEADAEHLLDAVYQGCVWRQFGFWRKGVTDLRTACEELINEVQAQIPDKAGTIADLGCGRGESAGLLKKYYPAENITGVCYTREEAEFCKAKFPDIDFRIGNPKRLQIAAASCDFVTWVRGFDQPATSAALLKESARILAPGGILACFDLLSGEAGKVGFGLFARSPVESEQLYRKYLLKAGFEEIVIRDVSPQTLEAFRMFRVRHLDEKRLLGHIDVAAVRKINKAFLEKERRVSRCILVFARKPDPAAG